MRRVGKILRQKAAVWLFCFIFVVQLQQGGSETWVDTCDVVHERQSRLGAITTQSHNLVIDDTNPATFRDDTGRFKRDNSEPGYITYESRCGFEEIRVVGYAYEELPSGSWSLNVTTAEYTASDQRPVYNLSDIRMAQYVDRRPRDNWRGFEIRLPLREACPRSVVVHLGGAASNNEFPGWGLQIAEVHLIETYYEHCEAECATEGPICSSVAFRNFQDTANDFSNVFASENIEIDTSTPFKFFQGDHGRFKRSKNETGELVYVSSGGIRSLEIVIFQYAPFDTELTVLPYVQESCKPIELTPVLAPRARRNVTGWVSRTAMVDLSELPYCPTRVALRIKGEGDGWELQIARVQLELAATLGRNPTHRTELRLLSGSGGDDGWSPEWWFWVVLLVGLIVGLLLAAAAIRWIGMVFGDDERVKYHISNWPIFQKRQQKRRQVTHELADLEQ